VAQPSAPASGPQEQAPQATRRRPPPVTKTAPPSRRLQAGDLICGACGEGNPPVRKFCRRCGESLLQAEVVKQPWWRKFVPKSGPKVIATGSKAQYASGGRDAKLGLRKMYRRARLGLGVLVIVAGVAYGAVPGLRSSVDNEFTSTKSKVLTYAKPTYLPVHPLHVTANMAVAGHPGQLAADEFTNTYWLAQWNPGQEPTLTMTFGQKVNLNKMIFYSGVDADYVAYGRPAALHLVFSNGESDTITPQDTDKPQTISITHGNGVTSVEFQISGVFPGNKGSTVAITEIELFSLKL
jgi:hypothetical protein